MKRIFISIPYTSDDISKTEYRVRIVEEYFIALLNSNVVPVSPIVTGHHLVKNYNINNTFKFWDNYCLSELSTCDELHVLCVDEWELSAGVKAEIAKANELNILVHYIPVC